MDARIACVLFSIQTWHKAKADMEFTFHHQTDNNISHYSLETMHSVQNVTDDWKLGDGWPTWQLPHINTAKDSQCFSLD